MQYLKALSPMLVTLSGMSIVTRPVQFRKALYPMLFTLPGIVIDIRSGQLKKAKSPMLVTLLGMVVFLQPDISVLVEVSIIALQLFRES